MKYRNKVEKKHVLYEAGLKTLENWPEISHLWYFKIPILNNLQGLRHTTSRNTAGSKHLQLSIRLKLWYCFSPHLMTRKDIPAALVSPREINRNIGVYFRWVDEICKLFSMSFDVKLSDHLGPMSGKLSWRRQDYPLCQVCRLWRMYSFKLNKESR